MRCRQECSRPNADELAASEFLDLQLGELTSPLKCQLALFFLALPLICSCACVLRSVVVHVCMCASYCVPGGSQTIFDVEILICWSSKREWDR